MKQRDIASFFGKKPGGAAATTPPSVAKAKPGAAKDKEAVAAAVKRPVRHSLHAAAPAAAAHNHFNLYINTVHRLLCTDPCPSCMVTTLPQTGAAAEGARTLKRLKRGTDAAAAAAEDAKAADQQVTLTLKGPCCV